MNRFEDESCTEASCPAMGGGGRACSECPGELPPRVEVVRCPWCGTNTLLNGCFCNADVDMAKPEAWDFLRSMARGEPIMVLTSTSPSWVRDLWDNPQSVLKDGTPCQSFSIGEGVMMFNGEEHPLNELRITIEKARSGDPMDVFFDWGGELLGSREATGKLTMEELRAAFGPNDPEPMPNARRYGPYDADPHLKGRRRRFRKQRKT